MTSRTHTIRFLRRRETASNLCHPNKYAELYSGRAARRERLRADSAESTARCAPTPHVGQVLAAATGTRTASELLAVLVPFQHVCQRPAGHCPSFICSVHANEATLWHCTPFGNYDVSIEIKLISRIISHLFRFVSLRASQWLPGVSRLAAR